MLIFGKNYRIKSGSRFTLFIAFTIVFIVMIANTLFGLNNASSLTQKEYTEITVNQGDNLWNIAKEHMQNGEDIRRNIHTLRVVNGISAGELKAGQTLLIPVD